MSAWNEIVTAALLGTEKSATPTILPGPLQTALAPAEKLDRESRLLVEAGALALWRRSGFKPARGTAPPVRAEPEERPFVSRASAGHLRAMLSGAAAPVLAEWLAEADRLKRIATAELLPALLEHARQHRAVRSLAMAAGGKRAQWLAQHNPAWSFAASDDPAHWDTGNRDQRVSILRALRRADPAGARLRLESVWSTEPADVRAVFLGELATNLSAADEPFLEAALDDRSKEVRRGAMDLLARLPGSALVRRMTARGAPLLVFKRGGLLSRAALEVALPPEPDAAAVRDGLDSQAFGRQKILGDKAVLLVLILGAIPLEHWTKQSAQAPATLLEAAKKNEFGRALATGWAVAACRQADQAWAAALLESPVHPHEEFLQERSLLAALPEEARAARLEAEVRGGALAKAEAGPWQAVAEALASLERPWPSALGRRIVEAIHRAADGGLPWQLRAPAETLLLRLPPALLPDAISGWPPGDTAAPLLELLVFRRDALAALQQT